MLRAELLDASHVVLACVRERNLTRRQDTGLVLIYLRWRAGSAMHGL
jgi:hypothetical protein